MAEEPGSRRPLDVICIGRSSVDLYGQQVGGRLEDMASFAKYVGGCPTNISVGTARLGLNSALVTRVGDEHMGRFIREQVAREGVDTSHVITDPERLTALVILGIRDQHVFPLIFYRENCADMALSEDDIDPAFIAQARCVTVTGTHLSHTRTEAAVLKALRLARENGARTALDIDYRPNLWGLAGHDAGCGLLRGAHRSGSISVNRSAIRWAESRLFSRGRCPCIRWRDIRPSRGDGSCGYLFGIGRV